jgi:hypothetical protein
MALSCTNFRKYIIYVYVYVYVYCFSLVIVECRLLIIDIGLSLTIWLIYVHEEKGIVSRDWVFWKDFTIKSVLFVCTLMILYFFNGFFWHPMRAGHKKKIDCTGPTKPARKGNPLKCTWWVPIYHSFKIVVYANPTPEYESLALLQYKMVYSLVDCRLHCLKNRPHFTFYTAEATNAILYGA